MNKTYRYSSLLILILMGAWLLAGCGNKTEEAQLAEETPRTETPTAGAVSVEQVANKTPDFSLMDLDGNHVKLSDYRGKAVILDFWATWCPPCKLAMPHLQEIHANHQQEGIVVLAVSTDQKGATVVKPFIKENGYTFKVLLLNESIFEDFGNIRSIPTTFIIAPNGEITEKFVGYKEMAVYLDAARSAMDHK